MTARQRRLADFLVVVLIAFTGVALIIGAWWVTEYDEHTPQRCVEADRVGCLGL